MKLNEIIKQYREENNLTMQEFADRCQLSKAYVSMLEKGKHPQSSRQLVPSLQTVQKLCEGMHCSVNTLFSLMDIQDWIDYGFDLVDDPVPSLTPNEIHLIADYRDASDEIREEAAAMLHRSAERSRQERRAAAG